MPRTRFWVLLACGLIGAYLLRTLWRPGETEAITAGSEAVLKLGNAFRHQIALTRKAEIASHTKAVTLLAQADTTSDPGTKVDLLHRSCALFEVEAQTCQERALLLQVRVDTLEQALGRQIHVTQCRVLFIPCLSRTQSLGVGLLAGAVVGSVLLR